MKGPIFIKKNGIFVQAQLLYLKDYMTSFELDVICRGYSNLLQFMANDCKSKSVVLKKLISSMRRKFLKQLYNFKTNNIRNLLRNYLYELQPQDSSRLKQLPTIMCST